MSRYYSLIIALLAMQNDLFAAEAGMPQLDPKYWASQAFWLILVFTILYISIAKFYLPKIKNNLDNRENKIKEDLDNANKFKDQSETKFKEYELIMENAKREVSKIISYSLSLASDCSLNLFAFSKSSLILFSRLSKLSLIFGK